MNLRLTSGVRILVDETPKRRWQALTDAARAPLQQCWTYGDAIKAVGGTCLRFELCDRRGTLAVAQAVQRRFGVSITLISLGPVWVDSGDSDKRAAGACGIHQFCQVGRQRHDTLINGCGFDRIQRLGAGNETE